MEIMRNGEPGICFERAILLTRSYKETEGEPTIIRRAKALDRVLSEMTIYILNGELIVGNLASKPRYAPFFPEYGWEKEHDSPINLQIDAYRRRGDSLSNELERNIEGVLSYWRGETVVDKAEKLYSEAAIDAQKAFLLSFHAAMNGLGHITIDYAEVLNKGLNGIIQEAQAKLNSLDSSRPENLSKIQFLKAVMISLDATVKFAKRFAAKARTLAEKEKNAKRREELLKISEICNRVPGNPARSFWEALQSFWFIQLVVQIETNGHSISPGRFDQYMYPFYEKDVKNNVVTKEDAQELLDCLWVKFNDTNKLKAHTLLSPGVIDSKGYFFPSQMFQNVVVGGQTPDGRDATNELSYMCLDATAHVKLPQPSLSVRIHRRSPEKFITKACELIKQGLGMPQFFNDEVIIPAKSRMGVILDDARNYCILGCVEIGVPGKELNIITGNIVNLAKCLELALNNGICPQTGRRAGPVVGDAAEFESFDEVWAALEALIKHAVRMLVLSSVASEEAHREVDPRPLMSSLVRDCREKAEPLIEGGAHYNFSSARGIGLANVADSLAAMKKIVFEDRLMSMAELKQLLDKNFEGKEELRQILLNKAPKYGNDIDYVDSIASKVAAFFCKEFEKYQNSIGGRWQTGLWSSAENVSCGVVVGATPDGRKAWEILADNISPAQGRDLKGPTAAARSVAKIDHVMASDGTSFHLKLHPAILKGEEEIKALVSFVKGFFELGGMNCQFNVISAETLRDAQKNPEKYKNLVIRVAGFSAFFTQLDRKTQDDIIARTAHDRWG